MKGILGDPIKTSDDLNNGSMYRIVGIVDGHYIVKTYKGLKKVKIDMKKKKNINDEIRIEKLNSVCPYYFIDFSDDMLRTVFIYQNLFENPFQWVPGILADRTEVLSPAHDRRYPPVYPHSWSTSYHC